MVTRGGDWNCSEERTREQIISAVPEITRLGRYSGKYIIKEDSHKFDFDLDGFHHFDNLTCEVSIRLADEDSVIPVREFVMDEKEFYAYQVGDCSVLLEGDYVSSYLSVYNKNPEKRQETIKQLEKILA